MFTKADYTSFDKIITKFLPILKRGATKKVELVDIEGEKTIKYEKEKIEALWAWSGLAPSAIESRARRLQHHKKTKCPHYEISQI